MMGAIGMQGVVRGYLVYDMTSSPIILGLVSGGFAIPMLVLALFGGAMADRLERRRIIQTCQAIAGIGALIITVSIVTETVTWVHLFVESVLNGIIFAFLVPARSALIPQLVGKKLLTNALALNSTAMSSMTLLAPALAGNLYNLLGPAGVYFIIAGLEGAAVVLTGIIRKPREEKYSPRKAMLRDIKAGLKYIRSSSMVLLLLAMALATTLLAMPFRFLMPIFVVDIYHRGPEALGLLSSIMGIGAVLGSMAVARMGRWRRGWVLIVGGLLSGCGLLLVGIAPVYAVGAVAMALLGLGDSLRRSLNMALILEVVDEEYRGRVSSVYAMNFGLMPLGVVPAGIVAQYFGARVSVDLMAALLLAVCLTVMITQKRLRDLM